MGEELGVCDKTKRKRFEHLANVCPAETLRFMSIERINETKGKIPRERSLISSSTEQTAAHLSARSINIPVDLEWQSHTNVHELRHQTRIGRPERIFRQSAAQSSRPQRELSSRFSF